MKELDGACGTYWEEEKIHAGFWVRSLKETSLQRLRPRRKNKVNMDIKEKGWQWVDLVYSKLSKDAPLTKDAPP
jgi:hypothetical protein